VVLSNVDRASFAKSNAGSLQGVSFDMILTWPGSDGVAEFAAFLVGWRVEA
jgi:hypothetical protein